MILSSLAFEIFVNFNSIFFNMKFASFFSSSWSHHYEVVFVLLSFRVFFREIPMREYDYLVCLLFDLSHGVPDFPPVTFCGSRVQLNRLWFRLAC